MSSSDQCSNFYGIGDVVGEPMLAHKATHEGKVAAEVIAGHKAAFAPMTIPSVAYTNPEVAWMGLTEKEAKARNIDFDKGKFPGAPVVGPSVPVRPPG
jgi:dihydrolipoamide dehydrogenase